MKLSYRADIDGLRAVAVLSVILFHAHFSLFAGGFIGVDVFFVISGYLITSIILKHEGPIGPFLRAFYEGRIRRLLPPAIPVLLFSAVAGGYLLSTEAMEEFSNSLVAVLLFVSNWFFWDIAGYFDGPSHLKPLLHTWSLSVEEQFYLFFPVLLLTTARLSRAGRAGMVCAIIGLSFAINIYFVANNDLNSAFYNSFGRFWEMAVGGILAFRIIPAPRSALWQNVVGVTGLATIAGCIVFFDPTMAFPGFWALLPTIGTALVIQAQGGLASKLLSTKAFVAVGLISYALYLWHWPLFAFLNIIYGDPSSMQFAMAIAATFAISTISYFIIERPIRFRAVMPSRSQAVALFATASIVFIAFGVAGNVTNGFPWRLPDAANKYAKALKAQIRAQRRAALHNKCWIGANADFKAAEEPCVKSRDGRPRVLLVGDSHAAHLFDGLSRARPDLNVSLLASSSCTLSGYERIDQRRPACMALIDYLDQLRPGDFDGIIMTTREVLSDTYLRAFVNRAARLAEITSVHVVGPIQFYRPNMPELYEGMVGRLTRDLISSRFDAAVQDAQFQSNERYKELLAEKPAVNYISPLDTLCPKRKCKHFDKDGWPILIDNTHMGLAASHELAKEIGPRITIHNSVQAEAASR
ncbi:acyltransferase family protein [Microvirga makkahensis]|uniref:Acyltransferase family protein n=1 Tax=Microvirga makkahensis TaxID=1128670 RepID=A0A7X3SPV7_9HYPH|nr:acyltransferase family protein [Microvirga makkahensis]MXQ12665.1 acyltransferase family protein [Microvirga makkahensis]